MEMSLTEYLNQVNPVRGNVVILERGEYTIVMTGIREKLLIYIHGLEEFRYLIVPDSIGVYTTDKHCNKNALTCFRLAKPELFAESPSLPTS
jgi:hypothetical protein